MPAPFGKCSPIFCLSSPPSVRKLRRVQVWPSGLMRCGVSPGESRSSLKLRSSARLCCSETLHTHTHTAPHPHAHSTLRSFRYSIPIICKFNFLYPPKHNCDLQSCLISSISTLPCLPIPQPPRPGLCAQPLHGRAHVTPRLVWGREGGEGVVFLP